MRDWNDYIKEALQLFTNARNKDMPLTNAQLDYITDLLDKALEILNSKKDN